MVEYEGTRVVSIRFSAFEVDVKLGESVDVFLGPFHMARCCDQGVTGRHYLFPVQLFVCDGVAGGFRGSD